MPPTLTIISTPIGHLDDLSPRAQQALSAADLILCEDTRKLAKLRKLIEFAAPARVLADYNEAEAVDRLLDELAAAVKAEMPNEPNIDPGMTERRDEAAKATALYLAMNARRVGVDL